MREEQRSERHRRDAEVFGKDTHLSIEQVFNLAVHGAQCLEPASAEVDTESLEEAIESLGRARSVLVQDYPDLTHAHPIWPGVLSNLGLALRERFDRVGRAEDLEEAVDAFLQAANSTPESDPARPVFLSNLGLTLQRRFKRDKHVEDLDEAVRVARQAVAATPRDAPGYFARLSGLGKALQLRSEEYNQEEDMYEVGEIARQIIEGTPEGHPDRPTI